MGWESFAVVRFDLGPLLQCLNGFLSGGYNLHRFSDAIGLVFNVVWFLKRTDRTARCNCSDNDTCNFSGNYKFKKFYQDFDHRDAPGVSK